MRRTLQLCALAALALVACRDNGSEIPLVAVDFTINVNEPQFFDLNVPSGWVYITGGSRGIIVYRNSNDEFTAMDRHAPYEVVNGCAVIVADDNVLVEDPCSASQWLIIDGSVVTGPTLQPLKNYRTSWANPYLRIYN